MFHLNGENPGLSKSDPAWVRSTILHFIKNIILLQSKPGLLALITEIFNFLKGEKLSKNVAYDSELILKQIRSILPPFTEPIEDCHDGPSFACRLSRFLLFN